MRVCDIVKSISHGTTRATSRCAPAPARRLRSLLGHGMGGDLPGAATRESSCSSPADRARVGPRSRRCSCQCRAGGGDHPCCAAPPARWCPELETLAAGQGGPAGRPKTEAEVVSRELQDRPDQSTKPSTETGQLQTYDKRFEADPLGLLLVGRIDSA